MHNILRLSILLFIVTFLGAAWAQEKTTRVAAVDMFRDTAFRLETSSLRPGKLTFVAVDEHAVNIPIIVVTPAEWTKFVALFKEAQVKQRTTRLKEGDSENIGSIQTESKGAIRVGLMYFGGRTEVEIYLSKGADDVLTIFYANSNDYVEFNRFISAGNRALGLAP